MALRLAGEEFSIVQGLDSQGWLREITRSDTLPGLAVRQQGSAPGLSSRVPTGQRFLEMLRESDGAVIGYLQEASSALEVASGTGMDLRLAPGAGGQIKAAASLVMGGNSLNMQNASVDYCDRVYGKAGAGLILSPQPEAADAPVVVQSRNGANSAWLDRLKVHSYADVARIELLNAALNVPAATHATPAEGDLRWNATSKKLQLYSGTAWETVSSA